MTNDYCKKHEEIEPEDNTGIWVCSKCSSEGNKKSYLEVIEIIKNIKHEYEEIKDFTYKGDTVYRRLK